MMQAKLHDGAGTDALMSPDDVMFTVIREPRIPIVEALQSAVDRVLNAQVGIAPLPESDMMIEVSRRVAEGVLCRNV